MLNFAELENLDENLSDSIKKIKEIKPNLRIAVCLYNENDQLCLKQQESIDRTIAAQEPANKMRRTLDAEFFLLGPILDIVYLKEDRALSKLKKEKKELDKNLEQSKQSMDKITEQQSAAQSEQESIKEKIATANKLQEQIIQETKANCRMAVYLHIKSNSSRMQGNASSSCLLEKLNRFLDEFLAEMQIDETSKQVAKMVVCYLRKEFEDYETNYRNSDIDSFLDEKLKQEIKLKIQTEFSNYQSDDPKPKNSLILRKKCPLFF
jgi:hypothetical protein